MKLENSRRIYERQKNLSATSSGTKQAYEQSETDLKVADAELRQARINARTSLATVRHQESLLSQAQQKLKEAVVKSPALGAVKSSSGTEDFVVSKRMVSKGEMVRAFPSTPVFELIADQVLKLHVLVPERYMSQVKHGLDVEVRVEAYPGRCFHGQSRSHQSHGRFFESVF